MCFFFLNTFDNEVRTIVDRKNTCLGNVCGKFLRERNKEKTRERDNLEYKYMVEIERDCNMFSRENIYLIPSPMIFLFNMYACFVFLSLSQIFFPAKHVLCSLSFSSKLSLLTMYYLSQHTFKHRSSLFKRLREKERTSI